MKSSNTEYMRYWRVIRYYLRVKHKLSTSDIEMLFFLHAEKYFTNSKMLEFANILPWDRRRFYRLKNNGWIEVFRPRRGNKHAVYTLTMKARRMIKFAYRCLNGEEVIDVSSYNKMFEKNIKFTDKVYRMMIVKMAEEARSKKFEMPE